MLHARNEQLRIRRQARRSHAGRRSACRRVPARATPPPRRLPPPTPPAMREIARGATTNISPRPFRNSMPAKSISPCGRGRSTFRATMPKRRNLPICARVQRHFGSPSGTSRPTSRRGVRAQSSKEERRLPSSIPRERRRSKTLDALSSVRSVHRHRDRRRIAGHAFVERFAPARSRRTPSRRSVTARHVNTCVAKAGDAERVSASGDDFSRKVSELKAAGNWNVLVLYAVEWARKAPANAEAWNELSLGYAKLRQFNDALEGGDQGDATRARRTSRPGKTWARSMWCCSNPRPRSPRTSKRGC